MKTNQGGDAEEGGKLVVAGKVELKGSSLLEWQESMNMIRFLQRKIKLSRRTRKIEDMRTAHDV